MIKVAALTSGRDAPSTRFRVRQHIELLKSHGIEVREYSPFIDKHAPLPGWPENVSVKYGLPYLALWLGCKLGARIPGVLGSRTNSITWLERELLPGYFTLEPTLKRPLVLDADDSIWLDRPFGPKAIPRISRRANAIVAGNAYLADWFSQWNQNVHIVPTAIDLNRYQVREGAARSSDAQFLIGWTGTAGTLKYLHEIEAPLARFVKDHPAAVILVVADKPPEFKEIPEERVRFVRWSAEVEATAIRELDVGIMPLPDDDWTRGKCSFKMLQYMACGTPVIVSPVGMNVEVLAKGEVGIGAESDADWYDALKHLYDNPITGSRMGSAGRTVIENFYSCEVVSKQLAEIFKGLA